MGSVDDGTLIHARKSIIEADARSIQVLAYSHGMAVRRELMKKVALP